jgi:hypothetical protein
LGQGPKLHKPKNEGFWFRFYPLRGPKTASLPFSGSEFCYRELRSRVNRVHGKTPGTFFSRHQAHSGLYSKEGFVQHRHPAMCVSLAAPVVPGNDIHAVDMQRQRPFCHLQGMIKIITARMGRIHQMK